MGGQVDVITGTAGAVGVGQLRGTTLMFWHPTPPFGRFRARVLAVGSPIARLMGALLLSGETPEKS